MFSPYQSTQQCLSVMPLQVTYCRLKNFSNFIWPSTVKKGYVLHKASIDWFITLHHLEMITSYRFLLPQTFELDWPKHLKHPLKNTRWSHRRGNQLSINQALRLCSVVGLLHVMRRMRVARNLLLKTVIPSNTRSHLSGFKCTTFLQKLVFILFSFISFQTATWMSKSSYEYPESPKKNLVSLVALMFSSGYWSGDSPAPPLVLTVPRSKAQHVT